MRITKGWFERGASLLFLFLICLTLISCSGPSVVETHVEQPVDSAIAASINSSLRTDPVLRNFNIQVEVEGGVVTLQGEVDSQANQMKALSLASQVDGVREVRNELRINPNLSGESLMP